MEKKCRVCQLNKALLVPLYRKDDETEYILCMLNSIVESNNVSLPKYICYPCLDNLRRTYYFQRKLRRLTHPKQPTNFQKIKAGEKLKENYTVKQQEFDDYVDDDRSRESGNSSNGNDNEHRPFKCDICGRGFKVKENFESHHNRHSRKREQFRCTECGLQFLVLAQFDRHTCKKN